MANDSKSTELSSVNITTDALKIVSGSDFAENKYNMELPKAASSMSIAISPVNSEAQITLNGAPVSAFAQVSKPLAIGLNVFEIKITADSNTSVYTINADRLGEQIIIAPDSAGVGDGFSEGGAGWNKSGLAIGLDGGTNTRYTAATGDWAKWSPNVTAPGYYRVLY